VSGSETLLQTGQRALHGRQWSKAAEAFGQLVRAEPGVVQGWLGLGITALEQKRYRLALQALDQALVACICSAAPQGRPRLEETARGRRMPRGQPRC